MLAACEKGGDSQRAIALMQEMIRGKVTVALVWYRRRRRRRKKKKKKKKKCSNNAHHMYVVVDAGASGCNKLEHHHIGL